MTTTSAIVTYKSEDGKTLNWKWESDIKVRDELKETEVMVDLQSCGLCHTDLLLGVGDESGPKILGHEGTGTVRKIGAKVTHVNIGDPVILSFTYCGDCTPCKAKSNGACYDFPQGNFIYNDLEDTYVLDGTKVNGKFFGQSSFAKTAVVNGASVVNVESLDIPFADLLKFGPLGCGYLTGAGAVINAGEAKEGESCVIYGLGGVGFSALMAAKISGCNPIIAVDILDSKLEIAKEFGATHTIKAGTDQEVHDKILEITGKGASLSIECIGGAKFVENAINNASNLGKIVFVGLASFDETITIPTFPFLSSGKKLIGCMEGSALPSEFIPKMIQWYREGRYPIDKLEKFYKIEDYQTAIEEFKGGKVVKPVLLF